MMTNRILYLVLTILPMTLVVHGQDFKKVFTADSIFIYQNFRQHGTTANLSHNHKDLESTNAKKEKLSSVDMADFVDIFKKAKSKKLFQQKYGGELYYMLVFTGGQKFRCIFYSSSELGILDNLDLMRRWIITDTTDKKRLYEMVQKNWP